MPIATIKTLSRASTQDTEEKEKEKVEEKIEEEKLP